MTILLTGATGFIGSEVGRQLAAAGQPTRAMIRRASRAPLLATLDVEPLYGDLRPWSELDLVPRYRGVLEGIAACLDGFVALRWCHSVFGRS